MFRTALTWLGLLAALLLLTGTAGRASAQAEHVELGPLEFSGLEIVVSFDLPPGYRVEPVETEIEEAPAATAVGPTEEQPWGPVPVEVRMFAVPRRGPESPAQAARAHVDEALVPMLYEVEDFDEVVFTEEGQLSVAGLEAYYLRVAGLVLPDPDMGAAMPALTIALPVARGAYVFVDVVASPNLYGPAVGRDYPEVREDVFDAVKSSLNLSMSPIEVAPPMPQEGLEGPVELLPISVEGVEYTYSLELPSGYTLVELGQGEYGEPRVRAVGPALDIGAQDELIFVQVPSKFTDLMAEVGPRSTLEWMKMAGVEAIGAFGQGLDIESFSVSEEGRVSLGPVEGDFVLAEVNWQDSAGTVVGHPFLILAVPADPQPKMVMIAAHAIQTYVQDGKEYLYTDVRVADRPAAEVHRENLDLVLGSLQVSVAGVSRPVIVRSVPGPDEISTDPEVIGSNIFLALFVMVILAFTSTLFNETLDENRPAIEAWAERFVVPLRHLSSPVERRGAATGRGFLWVERVAGPMVILVLTGLIYGFLDPEFGFDSGGVTTFLSLAVGVGAITYLYEGGQALFTRRRFRLGAGVKLYPVALAIAIVCVTFSRLVNFQPGFLYGFVASCTLLTPAVLDRRQWGQTVFFPASALAVLSVAAWLLTMPLGSVTQGNDAWWAGLPEGAATAVFVVGLEGLFFNMVPLTFMDGAKIAGWNRWLWLLMFGGSGFLFWHVLLNREGVYLDVLRETKAIAAFGLLAFYSIVTLATWAYFRGRVYGWSLRSLIPAPRELVPGALSSPGAATPGAATPVTTVEAASSSELKFRPLRCSGCGAVIAEDISFCGNCGVPVKTGTSARCPACGAEPPPGARFCGSCGAPMPELAAEPTAKVPKDETRPCCPKCGAESPGAAKFCQVCGASIAAAPAAAVQPADDGSGQGKCSGTA